MATVSTLNIHATPEALMALTPLIREGVCVSISAGRSLRQTLTMDLGIGAQCVEERIQTVFLDGSPVDDIDTDFARPGSTLALAGAMPGVAGIAMRRGSPVGVFREGVTHHAAKELPSSAIPLRVTLKLFNSVAVECLAQVLAHGVELRSGRLAELLTDNPQALAEASFSLNSQPVDRPALVAALAGGREALRVHAAS